MAQGGARWRKVAQGGARWRKVAQGGARWRKVAQGGARWRKVAQGGARWRKVAQGGARWRKVAQGGARWRKVAQGGARWRKVAQGGASRRHAKPITATRTRRTLQVKQFGHGWGTAKTATLIFLWVYFFEVALLEREPKGTASRHVAGSNLNNNTQPTKHSFQLKKKPPLLCLYFSLSFSVRVSLSLSPSLPLSLCLAVKQPNPNNRGISVSKEPGRLRGKDLSMEKQPRTNGRLPPKSWGDVPFFWVV